MKHYYSRPRHLISTTPNFNIFIKLICFIDVYSLKMSQRGSKHVGVEILVFFFLILKIVCNNIVHFISVVLCNYHLMHRYE